uniref:Uncharacterized protein n=1 Tax=Anopheles braziliensis TaxID=58242 RepID=A0A2M3ZM21_9DIPT
MPVRLVAACWRSSFTMVTLTGGSCSITNCFSNQNRDYRPLLSGPRTGRPASTSCWTRPRRWSRKRSFPKHRWY